LQQGHHAAIPRAGRGALTADAQARHRLGTVAATTVVTVTTTVPALPAQSQDPRPEPTTPRWPRVALTALLAATAALYLWGLARSGWANAFYSAAAQAGGQSWVAWFFGSSDAANAITVDKTPAALWVTGLSVRICGLSSWSILVPQALMGIASVGLLYAAVKRVAGAGAGLIAGAALALTPVAVLMFRFNNPDALLVLVLVGAAYATQRAVEKGGTRWLVLAGVLVGVGFLAKMLQAFLVLPALTAVWLLARLSGGGGGSGTCCSPPSRCWSARAGGCSSSSCGPLTPGPTSGAHRPTACWS